jgi:hypothetical protein
MKQIFNFTAFLCSCMAFSQVGVNTSNPQGAFQVDAAKDNAPTGVPTALQQANDMLVTSIGNVGIETIAPTTKLHLNSDTQGAIRITDGSQGMGKVLTSDANGLAIWDLAPIIYKTDTSQIPLPVATPNTWVKSNLTVTVPETGNYYINFNSRAFMSGTYPDGAYWKSELRSSAGGTAIGTVFGAKNYWFGIQNLI